MQRIVHLTTIITALLGVCALPQSSTAATVYSWKDSKGVMTFSDDPTRAPPGAQVELRSYDRFVADARVTKRSPERVTQGEFARHLATELGLATHDTSIERAMALLTQARIAPPLGRWTDDAPMTRALLDRLRTLTVAAAAAGRIALAPEQALYAFDTASDLVGIMISERLQTQPAPTVAPAPAPVTVVPIVIPVVQERVIFIGGDAGVLLPATVPVIPVNKRIVNIHKRFGVPHAPVHLPAARRSRMVVPAAAHTPARLRLSVPAR